MMLKPTVSPFTDYKFSQPVKDLYPQVDRDNPVSDPDAAISHAWYRRLLVRLHQVI